MILVIADDITGAAEMGGIALRYGLRAVLADDVPAATGADVLVVYTNTRSLPEADAVAIMRGLTEKAALLRPELFYKKTDSVLRGHVLPEMKAQMDALSLRRGLLIPVNPSLGRTIKGGRYYVNAQPVSDTSFAIDPEFPIRSSDVTAMLGNDAHVTVLPVGAPLLANGIVVGEATANEEIGTWAAQVDASVFCAGGAAFFNALLQKQLGLPTQNTAVDGLTFPLLFVSGTTFRRNVERIASLERLVAYMPTAIFESEVLAEDTFRPWTDEVVSRIAKSGTAVIAVRQTGSVASPNLLREKIGEAVRQVLQSAAITEVIIEGGATAYSVLQKLAWHGFEPVGEWQQGVVSMKVTGTNTFVTIKPGSYEWPTSWTFA